MTSLYDLGRTWQLDLLHAKGDISAYCAIGEIDVQGLRQSQYNLGSPAKSFNGVPNGFEINWGRYYRRERKNV